MVEEASYTEGAKEDVVMKDTSARAEVAELSHLERIQRNLSIVDERLVKLNNEYTVAGVDGDVVHMNTIAEAMETFAKQREIFIKQVKSIQEQELMVNQSNQEVVNPQTTLSSRDIPKFQLKKMSGDYPFPREKAYDSVEHFLKAFEREIQFAGLDVEAVWRRFIPSSLSYDHDYWLEDSLLKAETWDKAREMFLAQFVNEEDLGYASELVFTMNMKKHESISSYTTRFLKAVTEAKMDKDHDYVARRFITSLSPWVKRETKLAWYSKYGAGTTLSVEQISKVAKDILGDDPSGYNNATNDYGGADKRRATSVDQMTRRNRGSYSNHGGVMFCKNHGRNRTHETFQCYTVQRNGGRQETKNKFYGNTNKIYKAGDNRGNCFYCKQPKEFNHRCSEYLVAQKKKAEEKFDKAICALRISSPGPSGHSIDTDETPKSTRIEGQDEIMTDCERDYLEDKSYLCKNIFMANITPKKNPFNPLTPIIIENIKLMAKVDTGAEVSVLSLESYNLKLKLNKVNKVEGHYNFLSNNSNQRRMGVTDPLVVRYVNDIKFKHTFELLAMNDALGEVDLILGEDILPLLNISLVGVAYKYDGGEDALSHMQKENDQFKNVNFDDENTDVPDESPFGSIEDQQNFMTVVKPAIQKNQEIPSNSFCTVPESIIHINTKEGATSYQRQYPIANSQIPIVENQIEEWLRCGTIKRSNGNTAFNSSLLLVPKKDKVGNIKSYRIVLDIRGVNKLIPPINYSSVTIKEIVHNLQGSEVFTTLDLKSAYHRFQVDPASQHKLTFTFQKQAYSFQGCCFGLKVVTAVFSRVMDIVLRDLKEFTECYIDDIIVHGSAEAHADQVRAVIERLTSVNLILNEDKCSFFQKSVRLLGFVVDKTGTRIEKSKLANVHTWGRCETAKQVQQLMGVITYFSEYVPLISQIAAPINLLRHDPDVKNKWTSRQDESLEAIKNILLSETVLHFPDMKKPFYLYTDASLYAVSGALTQKDELGRTQHVSFFSKALQESQQKWSTTKRELYAIVLALKKFRQYIWGHYDVTIFCDHFSLVYLHTQKVANPMMIGWLETILDFSNVKVVHLPGITNILADRLSRLYPPPIKSQTDQPESKLVGKGIVQAKNKFYKKKTVFSKDHNVNLLAMKIKEHVDNLDNKTIDYMTPPEEDRVPLLKESHNFGHFGASKIVSDMHERGLHWQNMIQDALKITSSCAQCQKHNIEKKGYHSLKNIIASVPFEHVSMDLAGPLHQTEKGNVYLFVMIDICTRYIIVRAIPNKQSDTIVNVIRHICGDYGFMISAQSDNGGELRNSLMQTVCEKLGIERRYSVPYHSRSNGAAENAVKSTLNTLRKMCDGNPQDWDFYVPETQLAMNYQQRERTKSSPFSLMFARQMLVPMQHRTVRSEATKKEDSDRKQLRPMTIKELEERNEYMQKIVFPAIEERTRKIAELRTKKFDASNKIVDIANNTPVMIRLAAGRANKLAPIYNGPFFVVRKTQGGSYILKDEQNELLHRDYAPSELKVVSIDEKEIEDELYEIDTIKAHRGEAGNREYLVKWKGYGDRENTWEKSIAFSDPVTLRNYWKKYREINKHQLAGRSEHYSPASVVRNTVINTNTHNQNNGSSEKRSREEELGHSSLRRSKRINILTK